MAVTLQPDERDALWDQATANLAAAGDLEAALHAGDEEACYRMGRKIADGLRLIVEGGLGWQSRSAAPTVLKLPDLELREIMVRMRDQAVTLQESRRPDAEEAEAELKGIAAVCTAAESVLDQTCSG
jgi:hypothetical protein